ncbi:hypothetical protein SAMN00790413_06020 [Deinococcus hopiensis KR-140]|uniref:Uncharacterized protein n=1 Tax=Deinococcus hopiensis KR-140 TaxID=695939 RepID=A0A1W1VXA7_9DEIO|nr:hypothetical protein SAMN00790413_06020 [Deinococcus hopiensis KR-140]
MQRKRPRPPYPLLLIRDIHGQGHPQGSQDGALVRPPGIFGPYGGPLFGGRGVAVNITVLVGITPTQFSVPTAWASSRYAEGQDACSCAKSQDKNRLCGYRKSGLVGLLLAHQRGQHGVAPVAVHGRPAQVHSTRTGRDGPRFLEHLSEWWGGWKGTPHGAILPHARSGSLAGPGQEEVRTLTPAPEAFGSKAKRWFRRPANRTG